jgi:hypothetical protein
MTTTEATMDEMSEVDHGPVRRNVELLVDDYYLLLRVIEAGIEAKEKRSSDLDAIRIKMLRRPRGSTESMGLLDGVQLSEDDVRRLAETAADETRKARDILSYIREPERAPWLNPSK